MNPQTTLRSGLLVAALLRTSPAFGQQDTSHAGMDMSGMAAMAGPLGVSVDRMGSGTTWLPEASALPSYRGMLDAWSLMGHGVLYLGYNRQGGLRGAEHLGSQNWIMLMASRDVGGGRLQLRTMLSAEPWTVGGRGYPLLLQSGETFQAQPIHDRQHPHDAFMELGVLYERAVSRTLGVTLYLAPSGEPAIGPVAFMHRPSAQNDPLAIIGHHWQDATHITFGVVTAGFFGRSWKLEGSVFNGREPDERRTDFDFGRLDSYAARLTVNPSARWSFSVSGAGFADDPGDTDAVALRMSASALRCVPFGSSGEWSAAVVWGANRHAVGSLEHSALIETDLAVDSRNSLYGRIELVQKSAADLVARAFPSGRQFGVGSFTAGYVRELASAAKTSVGVGVRASVSVVPSTLESIYGTRTPMSMVVYTRVAPARKVRT